MKAIKLFYQKLIGLFASRRSCHVLFLFSLFFELAACPVMGQANNGIRAQIKRDRLFLMIEDGILGQSLLFVRHGEGQLHVVWTKEDDHLILQVYPVVSLAGTVIPVNQDYRTEQLILGRFPIIEESSEHNYYRIDATDLVLGNNIPWHPSFMEEPIVPKLSFVKGVGHLEFETLIRTERTIEYKRFRRTKKTDFSFFELPDPMRPRLFDHRMGYAAEDLYENTPKLGSIMRWRLEKKHKDSLLSEPVHPITFYYDPNLPDKWKPYVKAGILEWSSPFEKAGFKNAIAVKELPDDMNVWGLNSMNYSIVRWRNYEGVRGSESKAGATVNKYVDLRTGEILKADIVLGSSYQSLADEYFVRCAPLDNRAQQYPFPDDLMGELIQAVTAHEAGHAFGLKDGNFGEFSYPAEKIRDKDWLKVMGHTPSIMNYARHNYMVQPEDSIPSFLLIQKVGPMDAYHIKWGYTPMVSRNSSRDWPFLLEKWIRQQDSIAWYRFNRGSFKTIGPDMTNEVMDNNDPLMTTYFGLKNIQRVMELLPNVEQRQSDPEFLERLYRKTIELWYHQMLQVLSLIGGFTVQYKSGEQCGNVYSPISVTLQDEALEFLGCHAFKVPKWLSHPPFLNRIRYSSKDDVLMDSQLKLLSRLLDLYRLKRLEQMEGNIKYKLISRKLVRTLKSQLFLELESDEVQVGKRRQQLQKAFIKLLARAISENRNYSQPESQENSYLHTDYAKAIFQAELIVLKKDIEKSLPMVKEETTKLHLNWCLYQLGK